MKNLFSSFRSMIVAGSLVTGALVLGACNKSHNDDNSDNNQDAAALMAFNLAPDQSGVTIGLSGNALTNSPLSYTSFTGAYMAIYPGSRTVDAYSLGSSNPFASTSYDFAVGNYYSAFVLGANGAYKNVVVEDNYDSLSVANGEAYVRYINAITDSTSSPTVKISAGGTDLVNGPAAYTSVSSFTSTAPGDISVSVSNGGSINASRTITLEAKKAYTILLIGRPDAAVGSPEAVQIKFITNGSLNDDAAGARAAVSATGRSVQ